MNVLNEKMNLIIRKSELSDIHDMVALSRIKRLNYEKAQPQFWCYAGEKGDEAQKKWFIKLLDDQDYLMFTAEENKIIIGFIIGRLVKAPEVYDPGGLTIMIDDFCVKSENLWEIAGLKLIENMKIASKARGANQVLVVCGAHDIRKREFLMSQNLSIASEWFVGSTDD